MKQKRNCFCIYGFGFYLELFVDLFWFYLKPNGKGKSNRWFCFELSFVERFLGEMIVQKWVFISNVLIVKHVWVVQFIISVVCWHWYNLFFHVEKVLVQKNHKTHEKKDAILFSFFKNRYAWEKTKKWLNTVTNKFLCQETHGERWGSAAWDICIRSNQLQTHNVRLVC